jgi:TatD DNase family protein
MPKFIDTHCHVHFEAYRDDMNEVVEANLARGVHMVTVGTQSTTSANGIKLAKNYDGVYATVGLHPNHVHAQAFFDNDELPADKQVTGKIKTRSEQFDTDYYRKLADHPKVVAIGECGLDYYRIPEGANEATVMKDQQTELRKQLQLADELDLPVVIHCRDAHEDQIRILKECIGDGKLARRGVIHSFTGTADDAAAYVDLGFYLGINGIVTFAKELQEVVKTIPLNSLLLETDAPYLSPVPERGKRNEPWKVEYVAQLLSEIRDESVDEISDATNNNANELFQLDAVI